MIDKSKIHKGVNKEIRYFGLDKDYALQYLTISLIMNLVLFLIIGLTKYTLVLFITFPIVLYIPFKRMDKRNRIENIKKQKANKAKPTRFKRKQIEIIEVRTQTFLK